MPYIRLTQVVSEDSTRDFNIDPSAIVAFVSLNEGSELVTSIGNVTVKETTRKIRSLLNPKQDSDEA